MGGSARIAKGATKMGSATRVGRRACGKDTEGQMGTAMAELVLVVTGYGGRRFRGKVQVEQEGAGVTTLRSILTILMN